MSTAAQSSAADAGVTNQGATGDLHKYTVDPDVDTFLEASASQDTAELTLAGIGPDGELRAIDLPRLSPLREKLGFIAPRAGSYGIDVRLLTSRSRPPGSVQRSPTRSA